MSSPTRTRAIAAWGCLGVVATLVEASARLGARALSAGFGGAPRVLVLITCLLFAYLEGYLALHRRFSPATFEAALLHAARARGCFQVLLAPLYAASLLGAPRARARRAWACVGLILVAIACTRMLPAAARGAIDAGVSLALAVGALSLTLRLTQFVVHEHATKKERTP